MFSYKLWINNFIIIVSFELHSEAISCVSKISNNFICERFLVSSQGFGFNPFSAIFLHFSSPLLQSLWQSIAGINKAKTCHHFAVYFQQFVWQQFLSCLQCNGSIFTGATSILTINRKLNMLREAFNKLWWLIVMILLGWKWGWGIRENLFPAATWSHTLNNRFFTFF